MAKFPEPPLPDDLARVVPRIVTLDVGTELWRLYSRGGSHPTAWNAFRRWGPVATARFDHHLPPPRLQERGMLYAAAYGPACIAEVFQATRTIDRSSRDPWLVGFALERSLHLLDLTGTWPTAAGASMAINSGPRPRARRWSQPIYAAYKDLDGLWYPSSMYANTPVAALYERAAKALAPAPVFHRPLVDPALLAALKRIAYEIGYDLV